MTYDLHFICLLLILNFCCQCFSSFTQSVALPNSLASVLLIPFHHFLNNFSTLGNLTCPTLLSSSNSPFPSPTRQQPQRCPPELQEFNCGYHCPGPFSLALLSIHHMFWCVWPGSKHPNVSCVTSASQSADCSTCGSCLGLLLETTSSH